MSSRSALLMVVWEQNRGILVVLVLLLLACGGFYLAEDRFVVRDLEQLRLEQATLQRQLRQQQQRVSKDGMPLSASEQIGKDLGGFNAKIPSKTKFADFIGDLFAWADRVDLSIRQVSYQPKVEPEVGFLKYGLSFSVQGDYGQLKRFIHLLENSTRILIIDSITLAGRPDLEGNKNEVTLNIKLTTYFQEEGQ